MAAKHTLSNAVPSAFTGHEVLSCLFVCSASKRAKALDVFGEDPLERSVGGKRRQHGFP